MSRVDCPLFVCLFREMRVLVSTSREVRRGRRQLNSGWCFITPHPSSYRTLYLGVLQTGGYSLLSHFFQWPGLWNGSKVNSSLHSTKWPCHQLLKYKMGSCESQDKWYRSLKVVKKILFCICVIVKLFHFEQSSWNLIISVGLLLIWSAELHGVVV